MHYQVAVKHDRPVEGSKEVKSVTETYLFKAESYTDAETSATQKFSEILKGDFSIDSITKFSVANILDPNKDKHYLVTDVIVSEKEDGSEKKTKVKILVGAPSLDEALTRVNDWNQGFTDEVFVFAVTETKILEVFEPVSENEKEEDEDLFLIKNDEVN